ncbi:Adapter-related protein complex 4 subunit epsilon-1 [Macaca mulatta]|uniref:AP-4 complex subunit epsilon n=5 Tax=Macaca TaxID=9539 RepID=A0A8J8Y4X9_MACMU|nr:AP-4 complex subunit epsilon-1 isoform X1 [Macaca nemestrina]EHH27317.1 Adapter-related protein complex 4 subunit epsilon-1 [Macaca mulatta]EHH63077.1 Adapter-related protein complex 4 subunit epsilon-1 [Macaca fascicularis]
MSDIVEKTLTALPGLFLQNQPGGGPAAAKASFSSRLGSLVRGITALTSKHEEEKLIQQELSSLKATVSAPTTTLKMMKECMVRLIYCEMLGYDASFGYIHAIKLAQQGNLLEKRVGYLAVSLFLHESHELLLLLVNTVVKDLQSTNLVEVCMALTVVSQIFPREMIPAVLPLIEDKLQHSKEIIRRKAVLALYKFHLIAPNQVQHIHIKFRKALCDRDVGVMAASLHIYLRMIKENSSGYKDLTGSFVTILKQVVGGKLPVDFNYHSVPAPWLQIQLLRILGLLGKDDQRTSELMYDVLDESLRRAELNHNVTYAILFECVHTVYSIYPKSELLEKAAKCIGKFVLSPKINLKYLGLKALTYVIQQDPTLALQHQMTIIECLDHPDPIIKRETLELLYRITNAQNVTVIVQKMLEYLHQSKEEYVIVNLVGKIAELAEKYAPDNAWFIQTMNAVFSVGGDVMHPDIPNNFLRLLAEGFDDETEDQQLRLYAVQSYLTLLDMENVLYPQRFLQVMSWVLGEYSYLLDKETPAEVIAKLYRLLMNDSVSSETKTWLIAAVTKLTPQAHSSDTVERLIHEFTISLDTCMRQHAFELKHLHENVELMKSLLPVDRSCEDLAVDASLSFLDGFVAEGLSQGAAPYKPHHQRQEEKLSQEKVLNFEPYGLSFSSSGFTGRQSPAGISLGSDISGNSAETGLKETNSLKLEGIKKLWGKEGYLPKKESKTGDESGALPIPQESIMENVDQAITKKDQSQVLTQSKEEKEKQLLASSLFVGLGSESTVNLLGKADTVSHKFRRKSKVKEAKSGETTSTHNMTCSSFSSLSNVAYEDDYYLNTLHDRGDKELKTFSLNSELLDSESLTELPLVEKFSNCSLSTPSLFADNSMEIFHPPQSTAASVAKESSLASSFLEETTEYIHSNAMEICNNETISVSSYKIWKDDCLLMVWSVTNKSGLELKSANLEIFPAENFKVTEQPGCCLPVTEAESTRSFQYSVQIEKPFTEEILSGFISYHMMDTHSAQLEFSVNLSLLDFIRPLKISSEDFGKLWLSFANDVKQNVKMSESQAALPSALKTLQQKLRLHIIEIIGNEGLLACQLLPSIPCLLHCRVYADVLALWFRSSCSTLPDYLLYQCQKVMEGS